MATLTVTTLDDETYDNGDFATEQNDGGGLSLREALALAQDGDTISFDDALSGGTITLANGQLEITQDDITLDGDIDNDGTADITVDANGQGRVMEIAAGSDVDPNDVEIDGLVITGGKVDSGYGGAGILVNGDTNVIIRNSVITENEVLKLIGDGGGVAAIGDNIHLGIYDTTISANISGGSGGGIRVLSHDAVINISGTEISSNTARYGGGIHSVGLGTVINIFGESYIAHNQATMYGGGIKTSKSDLTISGGTHFVSNSAGYDGGAIIFDGGAADKGGATASITDTTFINNHAEYYGGAIAIYGDGSDVTIVSSGFIGNSADLEGGAIYSGNGNNFHVANSTFYGNYAENGGAILGYKTSLNLFSNTFTGNRADDRGGAVFSVFAAYLSNNIFSGNYSPTGEFHNARGASFYSFGGNIFSDLGLAGPNDVETTDITDVFNEFVVNPYTGALSGRLRDNGGPVQTVMINPDGLAHDGGRAAVLPSDALDLDGDGDFGENLPLDARGVQRVANEAVDIGAVELVITDGTDSDNVIDGDEYSEVVNGHGGDDSLKGMDGHDSLHGDAGKDLIYGNNGDDYICGGTENDDLRGSIGEDTVYGDNGRDYLRGNSGDDDLRGGAGGDTLDGGLDNDQLRGSSGWDLLNGRVGNDYLSGGIGNDRLNAHEGVDTLIGGDGDDTLYGNPGDDSLSGGNGDDDLRGGNEDDTLSGDDGNDTLRGNSGDDQFNFALGDDADQFIGFVAGAGSDDVIALSGFGTDFDTFAEVLAAASDDGNGNTVIDFGNGDSITLKGVDVGSLHDNDFVFV